MQLGEHPNTPAPAFFQANFHIGCKIGIHMQATFPKGSFKSTNPLLPDRPGFS